MSHVLFLLFIVSSQWLICSSLTPQDTDLIEQFYLSRKGEDLPWNKAEKAARQRYGIWHDSFLCPHAEKRLKETPRQVRCSSNPPFQEGLDECKKYPHSTGDCIITVGPSKSYTCECKQGWQCFSCNVTTLPCANVTQYCDANNYADCLATTDVCQKPICSCKLGYTTDWDLVRTGALQCQTDVDECAEDKPCENGGICENTKGSYNCKCPEKWAGKNCEYIKRCTYDQEQQYCGANAVCEDGDNGGQLFGTCKCKMGFEGNPYTGCGLSQWIYATASGDPHIYRFDNYGAINYMGTRPFTFARPNWEHTDRPFIPYMKVVAVSVGCGNGVACIAHVYVDIRNATTQHRLHFYSGYDGTFDIDGETQRPPYSPPELDGLFTVGAVDRNNFNVRTNFGFEVGQIRGTILQVRVLAGSVYDGHMYGIAGNMDRNPNNDAANGDTFTYENDNEGYSGTGGQLQSDMPPIPQSAADWAKKNSKCRYLTQEGSPFDMCREFLNETVMHLAFEDCAMDVGSLRNLSTFDDNTCEDHLYPVAVKCRNAAYKKLGVDTWKWRDKTGCPTPDCPDHSTFNENSPMCLNSCDNPNAQALCHQSELQEICMCDQSDTVKYVLDVGGKQRCVRWPGGCNRAHKGISLALIEQSVDINCQQNCLFVSQDANIVCKPLDCKPNSRCSVKDGVRDCLCNEGYMGDGRVECRVPQRDCADLQKYFKVNVSGVSELGIWGPIGDRRVLCDMETNKGGWVVVQKRVGNTTGFDRPWLDYVNGFGSDFSADFWYGLEALHILTNYNPTGVTLRVELTDCSGTMLYQEYENIKIGSAADMYRIYFGRTSGTAGDALQSKDPDSNSADGMQFSTTDRDNDAMVGLSCAQMMSGGWWYRQCSTSNLNGIYYPQCGGQDQINSIQWLSDPQQLPHTFDRVEMKMRPSVYPPIE